MICTETNVKLQHLRVILNSLVLWRRRITCQAKNPVFGRNGNAARLERFHSDGSVCVKVYLGKAELRLVIEEDCASPEIARLAPIYFKLSAITVSLSYGSVTA
jgi:hypothetical protein